MGQTGQCTCGQIRYRLNREPIIVHCCHCRWCQRETGAAFALNGMMETDAVEVLAGTVDIVDTPSESGAGQRIARCPTCKVAVWSHYAGAGNAIAFIRLGTLDNPDAYPPDIHIFTASKQPWVNLSDDAPSALAYYSRQDHWSEEAIARYDAARRKHGA